MWLGDFGAANAIAGNDGWSSLLPRECDTTQNGPPLFAMAEPVAQCNLATLNFCSLIVNGDVASVAAERMCLLQGQISPDRRSVEESFLLM